MTPETICNRCVSLVGLPDIVILDVEDVPGAALRVHVELTRSPQGCPTCGVIAHVKVKGTKTTIRPLDWHCASPFGHGPLWPSPCSTSACVASSALLCRVGEASRTKTWRSWCSDIRNRNRLRRRERSVRTVGTTPPREHGRSDAPTPRTGHNDRSLLKLFRMPACREHCGTPPVNVDGMPSHEGVESASADL